MNLRQPSFWNELKDGIAGKPRDYTSGRLGRAVLLLAVPMVLEMVMQSVFAVVDMYFIGRLGRDAVAAAGMTDSMLTLVFSIAMGLSMAAAAMVARRIGEKDPEQASLAAVQAIALGIFLSVPIAIAGVVLAPDFLRWMGATPGIIETGRGFTAIMLGTNVTVMLLFLINAIFRGGGDAMIAMRVLWLANWINIILDPIFIFGWGPIPAMEIEGAAIATATGRGLGVLYQLRALGRGCGHVRVQKRHLRFDLPVARRLLRISGFGMLQFLIGTASWLAIFRILALFGGAAVAGYTIAVRVIMFALLPSWGMGNAAATLVGQNLGARKPERAERSVWIASFSNLVFLSSVALLFHFYAKSFAGIFSDDAEVVAVAALCLEIIAYGYPALAFGMVMVQAFNGAGDTTTPTWINLFSYWIMQIPLAYVLSTSLGLGSSGVFTTIAIAQTTLAVVGVLLFRRGHWKERSI